MNNISLLKAWTLWLSGQLSPDAVVWGTSIFWWGRLGKMMQFVGAVTIIADIIGPEKIRRFGASLRNRMPPALLLAFLSDCFQWYVIVFRHTFLKDYYTDEIKIDRTAPVKKKSTNQLKLDLLNYFVSVLLTLLILYLANLFRPGWIVLIEAAIIFCCLLVSVAPIATVLLVLLLSIMGIIINAIFIETLAWALEHPSFDRFIKIMSLLLLLIGFHFELLAS